MHFTPDATDLPTSTLHVRAWLLSCRSLHLGIEHMMLRHLALVASDVGATTLGFHWRRSERNEPAAAFLFSMPGVKFIPVCSTQELGLEALTNRWASQQNDRNTTPQTVHLSVKSAGLCSCSAEMLTDAAAIARIAEEYVHTCIAGGIELTVAGFPPTSAMVRVPSSMRRELVRRLSAAVAKARLGAFAVGSTRAQAKLIIRGHIGAGPRTTAPASKSQYRAMPPCDTLNCKMPTRF